MFGGCLKLNEEDKSEETLSRNEAEIIIDEIPAADVENYAQDVEHLDSEGVSCHEA